MNTIEKIQSATVAGQWRTGGLSSIPHDERHLYPRDAWQVYLARGSERKEVVMPYPTKGFYSDEQVAELTIEPIPGPM